MKMLFLKFMLLLLVCLLFLAGCELQTDTPRKIPPSVIGKDLIIDEVFVLPPSKYYAYSWIEIFNPSTRSIPWFNESFPITAHVAGNNGALLRTDNDGDLWTDVYSGSESFRGIFFSYPDTGFAVGSDGAIKIIHHHKDGTFDYLDPATVPAIPAGSFLRSISGPLISPTVFTVGDNGLILRSTNRGGIWATPLNGSGTTKRLNSVYFESFVATYVAGDSGLIMKSPRTNQWDQNVLQDPYSHRNFYGIASQGTTEIAVGDSGSILVSRNGGGPPTGTWLPDTSNVTSALRAVYYNRGINRAWVVGDDGVILSSVDSLKTWVPQISGTSSSLRAVAFADSSNGWAVGTGGVIVHTTNGGGKWTLQESGTTEDLYSIFLNPPSIRVRDRLVVEMHAKRKVFFIDQTAPFVAGVNPNFDFIVSTDTGSVFYDPGLLRDLTQGFFKAPDPVPPQGWVIINSDSIKFQDHSNVGPGHPQQVNFAISFTDTALFRARGVLWDLLESGEVRLIRIFRKEIKGTGEVVGPQSTDVVDVVRWGGYRPDPAVTPPELQFPNNVPAGFIPEWYSLSRYVNDLGGDVNTISTSASFYMSNQPIPGWYSQRAK